MKASASRGYIYTILCSLSGGSVPTLYKLLLSDNGPLAVSAVGTVLSGVFLLAYRPRVLPTKASLPYLLVIGTIGAGGATILWALGLVQTTVVNATLLANGEVLFTALIAFFLVGERIGRRQAAMGALVAAGIVVVSTNLDLAGVQLLKGLVGNALILLATLGWAVENNVIVSVAGRFSSNVLSRFRNLIGGGILLASVVVLDVPLKLTPFDVLVFVLLGVAVAATTYLFIVSLQILGAIKMILTYSLSTIFGSAFALIVLREEITPFQLLGGALIIAGVYFFRRSEKPNLAS